jgi:hypothetical protein
VLLLPSKSTISVRTNALVLPWSSRSAACVAMPCACCCCWA